MCKALFGNPAWFTNDSIIITFHVKMLSVKFILQTFGVDKRTQGSPITPRLIFNVNLLNFLSLWSFKIIVKITLPKCLQVIKLREREAKIFRQESRPLSPLNIRQKPNFNSVFLLHSCVFKQNIYNGCSGRQSCPHP